MDQLAHHYRAHIAELNRRVADILSREALSGLVIHSGQPHRMFLDDINYLKLCSTIFECLFH